VDADGDRFPDEVDVDRTLAVDWANHPDYCDDRIVNTQPLSPAVNVDGVYIANTQRDGDSGVCYTGTLPLSASTGVHTMEDVPLTASGPGASFFHNTIDNTEVFFGMVKALGLDGRD
jgi:alkaline phosphatase